MGKRCLIGVIPLVIVLFIRNISFDKFVIYPERGCGVADFGEIRDSFVNVFVVGLSLFFVLVVLLAIFLLVDNIEKKWIICLITIDGMITREMMGFSATIYASSFRTFTLFIFVIIIATLILLTE